MITINNMENPNTNSDASSALSNVGEGSLLCQTTLSLATKSSKLSCGNHGKESIHSGQFMVSHFEAEAQDDDDTEIKMPDPDDPNYTKPEDLNLCTEIQLYVPQKKLNESGDLSSITSHLEIETSLTKLFKCMNLAYRQKLTSPKWNHFKGVRLRWKDKIRLNNLIWRCWHMQFILKKKTPVCQFASPLDVDVHSNPQSVVLEGKYWKRQLSVIKAEYNKWRRNSKTKAIGYYNDTKSEFDFLEWSPLSNDRNLMITEDWTSDTLFSAINVPFPFPDPREIARGAGIADFIQPSLGPLQPNLDDIDITFQELLQSTRLPPVPEEGADDILKNVDYNFPAIMGTEQLDSVNIIDVTNTPQNQQESLITPTIDDATMVDLNNSIDVLQQQYNPGKICSESMEIQSTSTTNMLNATPQEFSQQTLNIMGYSEVINESVRKTSQLNSFQMSPTNQLDIQNSNVSPPSQLNTVGKNNILKGRVSKTVNRGFRKREPHNYDKAQPTLHQTNIYQQMLAEQQQIQKQQMQPHQQQCQMSMEPNITYSSQQIQFPNNLSTTTNDIFPIQTINNALNLPTLSSNVKSYSIPQASQNTKDSSTLQDLYKVTSTGVISSNNAQNITSSTVGTYKNFSNTQNLTKLPSPLSMGYLNINVGNRSNSTFLIDQSGIQQQQQQELPTKEMFRSNSLPLNSSLQKFDNNKEEMFVIPKFQTKSNRSRTRSGSSNHPTPTSSFSVPSLQTATSEPLLNSTLAQLLTTNNSNKLPVKQCSAPATLSKNTLTMPFSGASNPTTYQQQQQQQQTISNMQQIVTSQLSLSPTRSTSLPQPVTLHSPPTKMMSFPPCLSPDSFNEDSPLSPTKSGNLTNLKYIKDSQRRVGHIHAEQKRRYNIKNGFDMLHSLIPQLQQNPNAKLSKAAMLQKGAEYIKQLRIERNIINEKMEALKKERDNLNASLSHLHSILPANGAPVSRQRTERVKQLYSQYVRYRTMQNWKFWILGLILEPLLNSYTTTVSMASMEELYRTALLWVDQHCSLVDLRPAVSNKLRYLSMTTDILSDPPSTLQEEVLKAVNNSDGKHPNLNSS